MDPETSTNILARRGRLSEGVAIIINEQVSLFKYSRRQSKELPVNPDIFRGSKAFRSVSALVLVCQLLIHI